jgi:hypothetical protein
MQHEVPGAAYIQELFEEYLEQPQARMLNNLNKKKALMAIIDKIDGIMQSRDVNQTSWHSRVLHNSEPHLGNKIIHILNRLVNHHEPPNRRYCNLSRSKCTIRRER